MKKTSPLFFLLIIIGIGMMANSCKKDNSGTVESLLSSGHWQLASVTRLNYIGSSNVSTDTLNKTCLLNQNFTFTADFNCSFDNFSCISQSAKGQWQLSDDKLTLMSSLSVQDTLAGKTVTSKPFAQARIVNLGQYSLILETGDLSSYYLSTDKRHIRRWGFIHN